MKRRPPLPRQTVLAVASPGVFMTFVDATIVNIALPRAPRRTMECRWQVRAASRDADRVVWTRSVRNDSTTRSGQGLIAPIGELERPSAGMRCGVGIDSVGSEDCRGAVDRQSAAAVLPGQVRRDRRAIDAPAAGELVVDPTAVPLGNVLLHALRLRATDALGNTDATPASITFTVKAKCSLLSLPLLGIRIGLLPVYNDAATARLTAGSPPVTGTVRLTRRGHLFATGRINRHGAAPLHATRRVRAGTYTVTTRGARNADEGVPITV